MLLVRHRPKGEIVAVAVVEQQQDSFADTMAALEEYELVNCKRKP